MTILGINMWISNSRCMHLYLLINQMISKQLFNIPVSYIEKKLMFSFSGTAASGQMLPLWSIFLINENWVVSLCKSCAKKRKKNTCPSHYTWKFLVWKTKIEILWDFYCLKYFHLSVLAGPHSDSYSWPCLAPEWPALSSSHQMSDCDFYPQASVSPYCLLSAALKNRTTECISWQTIQCKWKQSQFITSCYTCCHIIKITKKIVILKDNIKSLIADLWSTFCKLYLTLWMSVTGEAESGVANPSLMMSVPLGSAVGASSSVICSETAG